MQLPDLLRVLRRSLVLIVVIFVLGIGSGVGVSALQAPLYASTSSVFVTVPSATTAQEIAAGNAAVQQAVTSYANLTTTDSVLRPVISRLELPMSTNSLRALISTDVPQGTVFINITVKSPSADQAARIANALATQLGVAVVAMDSRSGDAGGGVQISQVNDATVSRFPVSPRTTLNVALGALIGIALGVSFAFLRDRLDTRLRSEEDLRASSDRPLLGGINRDSRARTRPLAVGDQSQSLRAEAFRSLRTNLQFLDFGGGSQAFVITSALQGEGKSSTAANLAVAVADTGRRVLLVDADLRRPRVGEYLGLDEALGLTDVIIGASTVEAAMQSWGDHDLHVLPAGRLPPNPNELLQGRSMLDLIARFRAEYDTVIFDAPPLLPVSDAALLAHHVGGALIVAAAMKTTRNQFAAALTALGRADARVLGLVLTMVPSRGVDASQFGQYGYRTPYRRRRLLRQAPVSEGRVSRARPAPASVRLTANPGA